MCGDGRSESPSRLPVLNGVRCSGRSAARCRSHPDGKQAWRCIGRVALPCDMEYFALQSR